MNALERLDLFAESEPRICIWCKWCGVVITGHHWGNVCIKHAENITKRHKGAIQPFPVNTGGRRTRVQCVNDDEHHDCFEPAKLTDKRIRLMDALGLLPED